MKKYIIYSISFTFICSLAFFLLSSSGSSLEEEKSPKVLSMTASVEVPDEITFAGEKIALDRYDMHERFDREINTFTYMHSSTMLLIKRANRIFPIIVPILKANNVPEDMKYLAAIESMLYPRALSPAKAAGLWQFMPATGTQFGLEVTPEVDERYHIEKSTEAACKYLKAAYAKYGNWTSVALSYNGGMGRISGELDKQQATDGLDLWLVEETSRYYFRMLAAKCVFENPYKYGFILSANQLYKPMEYKKVEVNYSISDLASFAIENSITYAQLKDANPWLRDRKLTISAKSKGSYEIDIPTEESLYYRKGEKVKVYDHNWIRE